ncbi:ATP-binding protein [Micromonospora sp. CPCC 206061]|uniref:ATP-binding protein n=1 Tax=Micromonospora sp. CPCC 206061 TaxID=3122410 RepID=UPI002FF42E3D
MIGRLGKFVARNSGMEIGMEAAGPATASPPTPPAAPRSTRSRGPRRISLDLHSGPRTVDALLHQVAGADLDAQVRLAREPWTVALARHLAGGILANAGDDEREAVQIAITEAYSNAVIHADPAEDYRLRIRTGSGWCEVQVNESQTDL